ncbi:hypothetical protein HK104_006367 [Borealophlyctis nickersoniae]|nr:hypothetical protein HK104_006367 [Borealophlyctis nickersoniae]
MSVTIRSITQTRFLPNQLLVVQLPTTSEKVQEALDAAFYPSSQTDIKTPLKFYDVYGSRNVNLLRELHALNVDWRVIVREERFWETALTPHLKTLFEGLDDHISGGPQSFAQEIDFLHRAAAYLKDFDSKIPPEVKPLIPPSLPSFYVSAYQSLSALKHGGAINKHKATEQDWTRRLYAAILDPLFSPDRRLPQSSNRRLGDDDRKPDHTVQYRLSQLDNSLIVLATEDQKGDFGKAYEHKDFYKLCHILRQALRVALKRSQPEDARVYGVLFGGGCACVVQMRAFFYTPTTNNPDGLRRPAFLLSCSPVWDLASDYETIGESFAFYVGALCAVYEHTYTFLVKSKPVKEKLLGSAELDVGQSTKTKGVKRYPDSLAIIPVAKRARNADEVEDGVEDGEGGYINIMD